MLLKKVKPILMLIILSIMIGCSNDSEEDLKINEEPNKEAELFYQNNLKPIIESKCISCHTYHKVGASRYDSYQKTKPAIHEMLKRIEAKTINMMPPEEVTQLTIEEKQVFQRFLDKLNLEEEEVDRKINVQWTAFKYPDFNSRVSVSGNFDEMDYVFNEDYGEKPVDILKNAEVTIKAESVNVENNEERSKNIRYFFSFFTTIIKGKITKYDIEKAHVNFEMNGIIKEVIFDISINDSELFLNGVIPDMNLFNWEKAYSKLNEVCGEYHQNKLWNDIAIEIKIRLD